MKNEKGKSVCGFLHFFYYENENENEKKKKITILKFQLTLATYSAIQSKKVNFSESSTENTIFIDVPSTVMIVHLEYLPGEYPSIFGNTRSGTNKLILNQLRSLYFQEETTPTLNPPRKREFEVLEDDTANQHLHVKKLNLNHHFDFDDDDDGMNNILAPTAFGTPLFNDFPINPPVPPENIIHNEVPNEQDKFQILDPTFCQTENDNNLF